MQSTCPTRSTKAYKGSLDDLAGLHTSLRSRDAFKLVAGPRDGAGNQATLQYQQTMTYFRPLWKQLRQKAVHPEMVAGLHMIVQDIRHRNYLHAYGIYMSLAIGAPRCLPPKRPICKGCKPG